MNEHSAAVEVIAAGHICLDIIPSLEGKAGGVDALLVPGSIVAIGPALLSTGGAVSNTGLALHRLGIGARLMGKIGDDLFGRAILEVLGRYGNELASGMIVSPGEHSSYTLVISPPGVDRIFLHCTGTNDTFNAEDVRMEELEGARLFHFGYPPLMRHMYRDGGAELALLLSRVKSRGLTVSLDMAKADPDSEAGRSDWRSILRRSLPYVDVFLPSFEELLWMLRPETYRSMAAKHQTEELLPNVNGELLSSLADELLEMGAAVVAIKLGEHGLYVKTTTSRERLAAMGACTPSSATAGGWVGRELLAPCFQVRVAGTTGAGDCTIAGFLAGLLKGLPLEEVLRSAVAVGACNVEQADATSGVPTWDELRTRMASGWEQRETSLSLQHWRFDGSSRIWRKESY